MHSDDAIESGLEGLTSSVDNNGGPSSLANNGIQRSSSEDLSALAGNSSFHDSKLQNLCSEAAVVECRCLDDDYIKSCPPTYRSLVTKFGPMAENCDQNVQSGMDSSNESDDLAHGESSSIVEQISKPGESSASINRDMDSDDTIESGLEPPRSSVDNNGGPPSNDNNGIQNSSSGELSALAGNSEAAVVECRCLDNDDITSFNPTTCGSSETKFSPMTDKSDQNVQSGMEIPNESDGLAHGQSSSIVEHILKAEELSTSTSINMDSDGVIESGLEPPRSSVDDNGSPPSHDNNGIQNSSSRELSGNSAFHDSKLQNLFSEVLVVECRCLDDDTSYPPTYTSPETKFCLMTDKSDQKVQSRMEISSESAYLDHEQSSSIVDQISHVGELSTSINRDMHSDDTIESGLELLKISVDNNESPPSHAKNMEVRYDCSDKSSDNNFESQECAVAENSWSNETLDTLLENSSANIVAGQDVSTGTGGGLKKPFQFLIKMPRFDDEKRREQIRLAQLLVDEKTRSRDAIWKEIKMKRENCQHHGVEFEAAKSEERAARKLVRSKRAEIEHLQTTLNRVKNAISVEEIDARICSIEHMIQHETLFLKEEKNFIREIKQLKQLRDQLSSNIGSCVEVQQARDNKAHIEENLKTLKKELDSLKREVSKAEAVAVAISLRYEEESKMHKELRAQYKAANEIRQAAYENLQILRKTQYEKNKHFRMYKDDAITASSHAACKDSEALHNLCANQVEKYMELWNRDDEFRKDYVRCNMRSTIRRLGTLDGRSLGPDESPPALPVYVSVRADKCGSSTSEVEFVSPNLALQQAVLINDDEQERKTDMDTATSSSLDLSKDTKAKTKEELELARKEEELRNLEAASRLKEQRRLEEISKAKEALERKKRNAEKAQVRAELRAQKEAEQREKEREKRMRKKERKKGSECESVTMCEIVKDSMTETESNEAKDEGGGKKLMCTKQSKTKSVPPPLRNKSKKRMQQWVRIFFTSLVIIFVFLMGNIGFFASLKQRKKANVYAI